MYKYNNLPILCFVFFNFFYLRTSKILLKKYISLRIKKTLLIVHQSSIKTNHGEP